MTKVIYLEDPDQAIPFRMPKDQVPVLTLSPTEPPLRVASALGRPVAIVRMGVRKPTIEEIQAGPGGRRRPRLGRQHRVGAMPVPDSGRRQVQSPLRAGRARRRPGRNGPRCRATNTSATAAIAARPRRPGRPATSAASNRATPSSASTSASKGRIEPRVSADQRRLHLCTPLRRSAGEQRPESKRRHPATSNTNKHLTKFSQSNAVARSKKLVQNQAPELTRERARAAGLKGRLLRRREIEQPRSERVPRRCHDRSPIFSSRTPSSPATGRKPGQLKEKVRLDGIKTAEGPVITGHSKAPARRSKCGARTR